MKCTASNKTLTEKIKHDYTTFSVEVMLVFFATFLTEKRGWTEQSTVTALKWVNRMATLITTNFTTYKRAKYNLVFNTGILIDKGNVYRLNEAEKKKWLKENGND